MKNLQKDIQFLVDLYKSKNLSKAELVCKKLIEANPRVAILYNILGLILTDENKIDEAIKYYEHGLKVNPEFAMIYNNLGSIHKSRGDYKKAEDHYKTAIKFESKMAEPHNNLGNLYRIMDRHKETEESYRNAIKINSKFYWSYYNLGIHYTTLGKFDDAKKILRDAIKINSNFFPAHRSLSRIIKYTKDEEHLKQLENLAEDINTNNKSKNVDLSFALGKALEDVNEFDKSFKNYDEGNSLYRKKINFSIKTEEQIFKSIKKLFNNELINQFKDLNHKEQKPIFILGMPRSGTTLVEQIISSHSKVFGAGEIEIIPDLIRKNFGEVNFNLLSNSVLKFNKENLKNIGDEYISKIDQISKNSPRTTDKLPLNFLFIGFIKLILPNAKIIHCERNSKDNILSIFKNHFPGDKVKFGYNLSETVSFYNLYYDLMKHWNKILPNFLFNIKYENLINETPDEVKKLLSFCELDWDENCLNFYNNKRPIKTASDTQARNKISKSSIDKWKNYELQLKQYFSNLSN
jgi:Tfp pilus assembly protein PilF